MIQWLTRRFSRDPGQLGLFEVTQPVAGPGVRPVPPRDAPTSVRAPDAAPGAPGSTARTVDPVAFLALLRARGMRGVEQLVFTRNRRTMVSLAGGVMRVHEGFAAAPAPVLDAIATFATTRNRARRSAAREVIVAFPVPIRPPTRRPAAAHYADAPLAARLTHLHQQLNRRHFAGALAPLEIQVSRRLARRLGHYTPRAQTGLPAGEIVLSQRHIKRDGWVEAEHTLLHEMVHQWQDETGRPVDHGTGFRVKCREVGIEPAATRLIRHSS
ncbi:MAG: SprT-like domain-containing protein [Gemmatimonadaceae bacterium]|nr:SprT-like domain-containing protein [Gemmatimonadaceae bacterium]